MFRRLCLVSLISLAASSRAFAESVTIVAGRDNTIFSDSTNSGGLATTLFAGRNNAGSFRRGLVWFDVAGHVPAGSTITTASLSLHLDETSSSETQARTVELRRVSADWGEGTSGGGGRGGGPGQPATPMDATWLHHFFDNDLWSNAGGDFAATPTSAATIGLASDFYTWPSTPALSADVQDWLDRPAENFGWAILGDESQTGTIRRFDTREAADPALRPMLTIEYVAVPEPATAALVLMTFAACVCLQLGSRTAK
jgi:hypothetical protein